MKDGLYRVHFQTQVGAGSGVVVLTNGQIRGGDAGMYYIGTYSFEGTKLKAKVAIARHTNTGTLSVFGIDNANIELVGESTDTSAQTIGTALQAPGLTFQASLSRLSD